MVTKTTFVLLLSYLVFYPSLLFAADRPKDSDIETEMVRLEEKMDRGFKHMNVDFTQAERDPYDINTTMRWAFVILFLGRMGILVGVITRERRKERKARSYQNQLISEYYR